MSVVHKNYRIVHYGTFTMYKIQPPGSGAIPKELTGGFTTIDFAKQAIDRSLESLKKRRGRKANGPEESTSTG
tara:strand:+ start:428 stop:646 length:219 start_codon:yes stop_codon:yes gene_type:complete